MLQSVTDTVDVSDSQGVESQEQMEGGAGRADKMNLFEVAGLSWERGEGDDGKNVPAEGGRVTRGDI